MLLNLQRFRPLTGSIFLNYGFFQMKRPQKALSFRPLTGIIFLNYMQMCYRIYTLTQCYFRPLTGIIFLNRSAETCRFTGNP